MATKIKVKDHERLDDANIERVIDLLEQDKPITITKACEELNINNNGARLKKIIQDYKDRKENEKKRRAANRGKPATEYEISTAVERFLVGDSLKDIADDLYRSSAFVKKIIEDVGVPQSQPGENYFNANPLPDQCVATSFEIGEFVWSSRDSAVAEIMKHMGEKDGHNVYRIWVHQTIDSSKVLIDGKKYAFQPESGGGYYGHQPAYELGSLRHLLKHGVNVKRAIK